MQVIIAGQLIFPWCVLFHPKHVTFSTLVLPVLPSWHSSILSVPVCRDEAAKDIFVYYADELSYLTLPLLLSVLNISVLQRKKTTA